MQYWIVFLAANQKKNYDENNIKSRQLQDRDETVLLLETRWQGKLTHKIITPEPDTDETGMIASDLTTK